MLLRRWITFWLISATLVTAGVFSVLLYDTYTQNVEAIAMEEMESQLENTERYLSDALSDLFYASYIIGDALSLQKMVAQPEAPIDYYQAHALRTDISNLQSSYEHVSAIDIYLSESDYYITSDYGSIPLVNNPDIALAFYRSTYRMDGAEYIDSYVKSTPPFIRRGTEQVTLLRPFYATQNPRRVGLIAVSTEKRVLRSHLSGMESSRMCVLHEGEVLLADNGEPNEAIFRLLRQHSERLQDGNAFITDLGGERVVLLSREMESTGWQLACAFYLDRAVEQQGDTGRYIILLFLCNSGIALITVMLLFHIVFSRLRVLQSGMKRVEAGDLQVTLRLPHSEADEFSYIYQNFNSMVGRIRTLFTEVYNQKLLQKEMQIKLLQSQIDPHFIYNIFENMNWFVQLERYDDLEELIHSISSYYRKSLNSGRDLISVGDTAELLRAYLDIQQTRFRSRLRYELQVDPAIREELLLNHLIQPLVENAVNHGVETSTRACTVQICFEATGEELLISVRDDGSGIEPQRLEELRQMLREHPLDIDGYFALINVNTRIQLYYGEAYGISIESRAGSGTQVQLRLPLHHNHQQTEGDESHELPPADR